MTQIFFPPRADSDTEKVYCYVNKSSKVVIAKLGGLENRNCERVVFPEQKFLFMANDNCELEIHQQANAGVTKETVACSELEVIKN